MGYDSSSVSDMTGLGGHPRILSGGLQVATICRLPGGGGLDEKVLLAEQARRFSPQADG